jgi:ATP-dependent helicase/nuclease subunit A
LRAPQSPTILQTKQAEAPAGYQAIAEEDGANRLEADIGTLAHLYLQLIAEQGLVTWEAHVKQGFSSLDLPMQRWFRQQGYADIEASRATKQVATLLTTTLQSDDGRWVLQPHAQGASELAIEQLSERKKVIDRTFIADGVRWIVDYKSMPVTANDDLRLLASAFKSQLAAYAQLFQAEGLPVKTAILFLSAGKLAPVDIH